MASLSSDFDRHLPLVFGSQLFRNCVLESFIFQSGVKEIKEEAALSTCVHHPTDSTDFL